MKKILLAFMLCSLVIFSGCKKQEGAQIPTSIRTYQELKLSPEQNKQLQALREKQRTKIDALRNDVEKQRKALLGADVRKDLTAEQLQKNREKYKAAANEMRVKVAAERVEFDKAMMNILDDKQKKTYQKYLKQREKEREKRNKEFVKSQKVK